MAAKQAKNTICLWFDGDAEEVAQFYAKAFPDSFVSGAFLALEIIHRGKKVMC